MEFVTLNNGIKMPMEGFGVFQVPDPAVCKQAVLDAIATGYRLIDTAAAYMNEEAVGEAIRECGLPRSELFITTKLWVSDASYDKAKAAIQRSMDKLDVTYIDLYLIHQPMGDYIGAYRAMEEAYKEGYLRAIGVCNCYPHVLADICETVEVTPAVNQVELHPFFQQPEALKLMAEYDVVPEAWGPFAEGKHGIFTNPVLVEIGQSTASPPPRWRCGGTSTAAWWSFPRASTRTAWSRTSTSGISGSRRKRSKRSPRWTSATARSSTTSTRTSSARSTAGCGDLLCCTA